MTVSVADSAPLLDRRPLPPAVLMSVFTGTLFLSALLLFSVQPMFAKMALPMLGGSPAVWAVSMCFFQAALLAGYAYAHALVRFAPLPVAVAIHGAILLAAWFALPIGLPARLGEPPAGDAYLWLTGVLALGVGLPFFAVSANAPLLQAWFSRTGHSAAHDPYFLYGASNIGSLLALLAYPVVVEPMLGVNAQARAWSGLFPVLAVAVIACGALAIVTRTDAEAGARESSAEPLAAPTAFQRALWILLAAIPSGLMVAVTTYITTDIAAAPFLWVVPLALFLATFILVFRDRVWRRFDLLAFVLPVLVLLALVLPRYRLILSLAAFFVAALVCHRELFLQRPDRRNLTEFYLFMSLGGVIGGVFAAILAPKLFTSTIEYQLLLIAALFCVPGLLFRNSQRLDGKRLAGIACLALACLSLSSLTAELGGLKAQVYLLLGLIAAICLFLLYTQNWPEQRFAFMASLGLVMLTIPDGYQAIRAERSFFGTVRVLDTSDGDVRMMLHGTTLHGLRRLKSAGGEVVKLPEPASYYQKQTPMARGFAVVRDAKTPAGSDATPRILAGIVGLGTGSLACYARPGDAFRFFEIDPAVIKVATTPRYFDFLSTCTPSAPIIVGDARLTLQKEPDDVFDYLVIDAFSSDSVPTHLLTVEALKLYLTKITDNGLIALHVSNKFMDLAGALSSTLDEITGAHGVFVRFRPAAKGQDAAASNVVFVSRNARVLDAILNWPDAEGLPRVGAKPWTDDYSNVAAAVLRHFRK